MEKDIYERKLSIKDFKYICKSCLSKTNVMPIENNILELFRVIIPDLQVDMDDNLPNQVCKDCITKLNDTSVFITLVKTNDLYLKEVLENSKVVKSVQDTDFSKLTDNNSNDSSYNVDDSVTADFHSICSNLTKSRNSYKKEHCLVPTVKSNNFLHFKCNECNKIFYKKRNFKLHLRSHTKETPFECTICLKKFRYASNLKRHDNIVHKGLKPFKCDTCHKEFAILSRKTEHERIHTGERPFVCNICGLSFKKYSTYYAHEKRHKITNGLIPKSGEIAKKYPRKPPDASQVHCEICQKNFSSKQALFVHKKIHSGNKSFLCSQCGKGFLRKSHLEVHFRIHTGEKPYECSDCGKHFRQLAVYRNHLLIHDNKRPFKCEICQKSFIQLGHLQNHLKAHTGEKPYKCTVCNKSFSQNGNLRAHTRIHTNERPFKCAICYLVFSDSSSLKKHKKTHNIDEIKTESLPAANSNL